MLSSEDILTLEGCRFLVEAFLASGSAGMAVFEVAKLCSAIFAIPFTILAFELILAIMPGDVVVEVPL
jgi:hypothetical protein